MSRRRSGLNFSRRRKKFNLPLFKEVLSWILEILVVIVIAYVSVEYFGFRTSVVGQAMESTLKNEEQILVNKFGYLIFKCINNLKQPIKGLLQADTKTKQKCEKCKQKIWQNKKTRIQKAQKLGPSLKTCIILHSTVVQ